MAKYEIMLIVDPKAELDNVHTLTKEVFKEDLVSFEKMERTELAYPINKQMRAIYALINLDTKDTNKIKEFQRRVAISKEIWRELIINVDTEIGLGKKPKKFKGRMPFKPGESRDGRSNSQYRERRFSKDRLPSSRDSVKKEEEPKNE